MRIFIATPLFPPDIGGPAQYAVNLEKEFSQLGHEVRVLSFSSVLYLPTGVRHIMYLLRASVALFRSDVCIILDTFSVALPTVLAGKLLRKKMIIRTGGDFLWESYVERTGDMALLLNFYAGNTSRWNLKERVVFRLTRWLLHAVNIVVFSTEWQRSIWLGPYALAQVKTAIIENFYGEKEHAGDFTSKTYIGGVRDLKWKNVAQLKKSFALAKQTCPEITLDITHASYEQFIEKMRTCYAVVLVSLGDISPNIILDAVRLGKPFILTRETGLYEILKDVGVFVDPTSEKDIAEKIIWLSDGAHYREAQIKIHNFYKVHSWKKIAQEFLALT
ncbi:MAG: glycosyltransferase family 4 protein [Patescibacteria group bacterium]